jgi:hypothetical protein
MPIVCFSYDYLINNRAMPVKTSYANLPEKKKDFREKIDKLVKDADHLRPNDWESEEVAYQAIKAEESYKFPTFKEYSQLTEGMWSSMGLMAAGPIIAAAKPFARMIHGNKFGTTDAYKSHMADTVAAIGVPVGGMALLANQAAGAQEDAALARAGLPRNDKGRATLKKIKQKAQLKQTTQARQNRLAAREKGVQLGPQAQQPVGAYTG